VNYVFLLSNNSEVSVKQHSKKVQILVDYKIIIQVFFTWK